MKGFKIHNTKKKKSWVVVHEFQAILVYRVRRKRRNRRTKRKRKKSKEKGRGGREREDSK